MVVISLIFIRIKFNISVRADEDRIKFLDELPINLRIEVKYINYNKKLVNLAIIYYA